MTLTCPRDGTPLELSKDHRVTDQHCPTCGGGWFTLSEFESLEAGAANENAVAGTVEYSKRLASLSCPSCAKPMTAFDYRGHNLELDACDEEHGFWLERGAVDQVRSIMRERARDLDRSGRLEAAWYRERERGFSLTLADRLRRFWRG